MEEARWKQMWSLKDLIFYKQQGRFYTSKYAYSISQKH